MLSDACGANAHACDVNKYVTSGFAMLQMILDSQLMKVSTTSQSHSDADILLQNSHNKHPKILPAKVCIAQLKYFLWTNCPL